MTLLEQIGRGFRIPANRHWVRIWALLAVAVAVRPEVLAAEHPPPTQWFPLQPGNVWILQSTNRDTRAISCQPISRSRWLVRGIFPAEVQLRGNSAGLVWGRESARAWQDLFRFGRQTLQPWRFNLTGARGAGEQAHWMTTPETVHTPAGAFTGCRHLQLAARPGLNPAGGAVDPAELWFAPNVGPVGLQSAAGDLYLLAAAQVGQQNFPPTTNDLVATLAADRAAYTNDLGGCPPCVTNSPPCELPCYDPAIATAHCTFAVRNRSANPIQLSFPTNQQFDIDLIDSAGAVVKAWSDGRAFANIVTTVTLEPGQTKAFVGDISLVDRQGKPLQGEYVARAFLTAGDPPVQATTVITVTRIAPGP